MHRPHRAWAVCLGGALSLFTVMGLCVNVFSIYQPEIIALNGFTNAQGSLITTTRSLFALMAMLVVGLVCARLGLRGTMTLGLLSFALSCFLFGVADTFPLYCAAAALSGISYSFGGMIPLSILISRWFRDRRGLGLGLAAAGSGLSTILIPPVLTRAIHTLGLAPSFFAEGGLVLVLTVLAFLLIRDRPEELGLEPYHTGGPTAPVPPPRPKPEGVGPWAVGVALLCSFLIGAPAGPGFSHLTVLYATEGFSGEQTALLMSCLGLVLIVAKVLYGQLSDLLGGFRSNFLIGGVCLVGLLLCCMAPTGSFPLALLAMTFMGLGLPISSVTLSVWAFDLSSDAQYERTIRQLTIAYMVGNLLTGPIPGVLADATGSYVPSYQLFALCLAVSLALIQGVYLRLGLGAHPVRLGRTAHV